jgi:diguanylate cyclase (GGDEF)-like protein
LGYGPEPMGGGPRVAGSTKPETQIDAQIEAPIDAGFTSRPLEPVTRASVVALVRALEVYDPPAARRAALRAHVVDRIADSLDVPIDDRVDAITGALLAEIAIVLSHTRPVGTVDVDPDPASAVLAASMLGRLPGLSRVARTVRHQFERWDGSGGPHGLRGPEIPLSARLLAVASTLVGHPQPGSAPNWTARRHRIEELTGSALDPDIAGRHNTFAGFSPSEHEPDLEAIFERLESFVANERNSPVEALVNIGAAIRAADSMHDVLMIIGEQARRALDASRVTIGRLDHDAGVLEVLMNVGDLGAGVERFPSNERHALDDAVGLGQVLSGEGFVRTIEERRADDTGIASLHDRRLRSEAVWPIVMSEVVWGVVWAVTAHDNGMLDHDDLATLRLVATHVATAVSQAERIAEFEDLALRDPLTGLGNRRVLDQVLRDVFERPAVDRQDVALIMCDIDGLKEVNDLEGHSAGDVLLVEAAEALLEAADVVKGSTVCRIGGDEFCIILDGGGMLSAHPIADQAAAIFARSGANRSLSSGVALAGTDMKTPADLLSAADEAQYAQKRMRKGLSPLDEADDHAERRRHRRA